MNNNNFKKNCIECLKFKKEFSKYVDEHKNRIIDGFGSFNAETIFIGEGPGSRGAVKTGVPFTRDSSGRIFQKLLIKLSFSENAYDNVNKNFIPENNSLKCFITNVFRNYAYKKINGRLLKEYREHCLHHLDEELQQLKNLKEIVIIGKDKTNNSLKEYFKKFESYNIKILRHPSYFKNFYYENKKHLTEDECVSRLIEEFNHQN